VRTRYWWGYVPGQGIYLETVKTELRTDMIVENTDPENPKLKLISRP